MARDLIPPPSPAGRPRGDAEAERERAREREEQRRKQGSLWHRSAEAEATEPRAADAIVAADPDAASEEARDAATRTPAPRETPYRSRFGLVLGGLIGLAIATVAIGAAVYVGTDGNNGAPDGWSTWKPSADGGVAAAKQIATHVGRKYRLSDGNQIVGVQAGPLEVFNVPLEVALRTAPQGGNIDFIDGKGLMFTLNGLGPKGSIRGGKPSEERHLLLRREALELALYTFRYIKGVDEVVALLPPKPPTTTKSKDGRRARRRTRPRRRCSSARATSSRSSRSRCARPSRRRRRGRRRSRPRRRAASTRSRAATSSSPPSSRARTSARSSCWTASPASAARSPGSAGRAPAGTWRRRGRSSSAGRGRTPTRAPYARAAGAGRRRRGRPAGGAASDRPVAEPCEVLVVLGHALLDRVGVVARVHERPHRVGRLLGGLGRGAPAHLVDERDLEPLDLLLRGALAERGHGDAAQVLVPRALDHREAVAESDRVGHARRESCRCGHRDPSYRVVACAPSSGSSASFVRTAGAPSSRSCWPGSRWSARRPCRG
jgi:hypothetical protein